MDCRTIIEACPYLEIYKIKGKSDKLYNCKYLNSFLSVEHSHISGSHLKRTVTNIKPHWECKYWQQVRKDGIYPNIQARINEQGKYELLGTE
jgi:hypothetical protein